jgi:hypothetical protein
MKKRIYRFIGVAVLIYFGCFFISVISDDISYYFSHITYPRYYTSVIILAASLYLGLFYFYYGIKPTNINRSSDISLIIFVVGLIIYLISRLFACFGNCPNYFEYVNYLITILPSILVITIIISVISILKNRR